MGFGLTVGAGLAEVIARGVVDAAGEGETACGAKGSAQAQANTISARLAHLMPVERTRLRQRYRTS